MKQLLTGIAIGYSVGIVTTIVTVAMDEASRADFRTERGRARAEAVAAVAVCSLAWPAFYSHVMREGSWRP